MNSTSLLVGISWTIWYLVIPFVTSLISTLITVALLSLPARRLRPDAHWSELARVYQPVSTSATVLLVWMGLLALWFISGPENADTWAAWSSPLAVIFGWRTGYRLGQRGVALPVGARLGRFSSALAMALLLPAALIVISLLIATHGRDLDRVTGWIAVAATLGGFVLICGGSVELLRAFKLITPAPQHVTDLVQSLALRRGVTVRSVSVLHITMANAFALPWSKELLFTPLAIQTLTDEELMSVAEHELGHLREGLGARLGRSFGVLSLVAYGLIPSAIRSGQIWMPAAMLGAAWLISKAVVNLHRRLEVQADSAASDAESAAGVYARALEKIHATNLIPAVFVKDNLYPHLYDRMLAAGVTPDFERPRPPRPWVGIIVAICGAALFYASWYGLANLASSAWTALLPDWQE